MKLEGRFGNAVIGSEAQQPCLKLRNRLFACCSIYSSIIELLGCETCKRPTTLKGETTGKFCCKLRPRGNFLSLSKFCQQAFLIL